MRALDTNSQDVSIQDPLAQLRDIHLPDPISWWPPAIGWWLLVALLGAAIIYGLRWFLNQRAYNCYRTEALRSLDQLKTSFINDRLRHCQEILGLLRRTAKTAYPQLSLESEPTPSMLSRLNQCCANPVFNENLQQRLGDLPYQENPEIPPSLLQELDETTRKWLKKHRRKAPSC